MVLHRFSLVLDFILDLLCLMNRIARCQSIFLSIIEPKSLKDFTRCFWRHFVCALFIELLLVWSRFITYAISNVMHVRSDLPKHCKLRKAQKKFKIPFQNSILYVSHYHGSVNLLSLLYQTPLLFGQSWT